MANKKRSRLPAGIKQLADGRLQIRATRLHPYTGRRQDRVSTLPRGTSIPQAMEHLTSMRRQLAQPTAKPQLLTLEDCCDWWLKRKVARGRKATTLEGYAYRLGACLERSDATTPINRYDRAQLLFLRSVLESEAGPMSAKTISGIWKVWVLMIREVCRDRNLPDPTVGVEGPAVHTKPRREQDTLTAMQVRAVVSHVAEHTLDSDYDTLIGILAFTGCRLGEAIGMDWSQVRLASGVIVIDRSATWTRTGGWQVGTPKSGRPRKVGMGGPLHRLLHIHRRRKTGDGVWDGVTPKGLVCASASGGYLQATSTRRRLKAASKALDLRLKVTPQVLRRTWNTLALAILDRVLVQAQMGHMDDSMSEHYLGIGNDTLRKAAEAMWEIDVGGGLQSASSNEDGGP